MFQHFGNRLKRDLKQLVDRRLDAGVLASGSTQKSSGVEVDVISHKRQRCGFEIILSCCLPDAKY